MRPRVFLWMMLLSLGAAGQQTQEFFDIHGLQGTIKYSGSLSDSLLPERGNYELSWRDLEGDSVFTYYAHGRLQNHEPVGPWSWREGRWQYAVRPGSNVEPLFNAFGKRVIWSTTFKNGARHGAWQAVAERINEQGEKQEGLLRVKAFFNEGRLHRNIEIVDHTRSEAVVEFKLPLNDRGEAHGKWVFTYPVRKGSKLVVKEERFYENGLLYKVVSHWPDTSLTEIREREASFLTNLKNGIDNAPLQLGGYAFHDDGVPGAAPDILESYLNRFLLAGWSHTYFPYKTENQRPIFRKLRVPLNETELKTLSDLEQRVDSMRKEVQSRLAYRNIGLNRARSQELDIALAFTSTTLKLLNQTDSMLRRINEPLFTYCNRFGGDVMHWADTLNTPGNVHGEVFNSVHADIPVFAFVSDSLQLFNSIKLWLSNLNKELAVYANDIDEAYDVMVKEGEVAALSDLISEKREVLKSDYADIEGLGAYVREQWVNKHLNGRIQQFLQEQNYQQAMQKGNAVLDRMDTLQSWVNFWTRIDSMPEKLQEQYTYFVYNPYTGEHDIEMPVKRRFFVAVQEKMWPYLKQKLVEIDQWNEWVSHMELTRSTFNNLMLFASMDDRSAHRQERRIRREDNPEKMVRMLHNFMESR